jgi:hypothetical protein
MIRRPDVRAFLAKQARTAVKAGPLAAARASYHETRAWLGAGSGRGRLIWEDDWDVCLVLDACRWDLWEEVAPGRGFPATEPRWSAGSCSPEWYGANFRPGAAPDERVGVVTANPFSGKPGRRAAAAPDGSLPLSERGLAHLDEVWRDSWGVEAGAGRIDVADPAAVTERAVAAWRGGGLDRLVVHYMQPHIPFRRRPAWFGERGDLGDFGEPSREGGTDPWKLVRDGELPEDQWWAAYADNLAWALGEAARVRDALGATILVTSDHGNAMGEGGVWSHPPGVQIAALREVPWETVEGRGPAELGDAPAAGSPGGCRDVGRALADLGYR